MTVNTGGNQHHFSHEYKKYAEEQMWSGCYSHETKEH